MAWQIIAAPGKMIFIMWDQNGNGGIDLADVVWIAGAIIAIVGAITAIWKLLKPLCDKAHAWLDWQQDFRRAWEGEPEAPGRDAVPGVPERLAILDGELQRNGGKSVKDIVMRLDANVSAIVDELAENRGRIDAIETRQKTILTMLGGTGADSEKEKDGDS